MDYTALSQQFVTEFGPIKSMLIAAGIGLGLGQIPFKLLGIKFSGFLLRMVGKSSGEKIEDKIIKALVDFINGMETDDGIEIQLVRKNVTKRISSPSGTDKVIVEDVNNVIIDANLVGNNNA